MSMQKSEAIRREQAEHYIAANKSDPFCRGRVECHIRNGITGFLSKGQDAFYKATPYQEERVTALGTTYTTTVYKNIERP